MLLMRVENSKKPTSQQRSSVRIHSHEPCEKTSLDMRKWAQYRARLASDESTEDLPESKDGAPKFDRGAAESFVRDGASKSDRTEGAP